MRFKITAKQFKYGISQLRIWCSDFRTMLHHLSFWRVAECTRTPSRILVLLPVSVYTWSWHSQLWRHLTVVTGREVITGIS